MACGARSRVGSILRVESLHLFDSANSRLQMQAVEHTLRVEICESFELKLKCLWCRFCWFCPSFMSTVDQTFLLPCA